MFTALLSGAVFLLARSYGEARRSGRLLTFCSGLSFGIYLAHPLAISFWERLWPGWMGSTFAGMGAHLLFFAAVLLSCFAGVLLAASLPGVCFPDCLPGMQSAVPDKNARTELNRSARLYFVDLEGPVQMRPPSAF